LSIHDRSFLVKAILDRLRSECGHSEFGYRMQAILAHVLLRLGARILEINPQGHPDIAAEFLGRHIRIQVKAVLHSDAGSELTIGPEDYAGIALTGYADGYLAVLDCALPVSWLLIPADRVRLVVARPALLATFRADCQEPLSTECTDVFFELISEAEKRLPLLTFRLLANRALRGESL
jgi:hypothetical protein